MWKKDNNKKEKIQSLRNRAIIFALSVSLLIVLISLIGYSNIKTFNDDSTVQIQERDDLLGSLSLIRGKLLGFHQNLNQFLLMPENITYQKQVVSKVKEAFDISLLLKSHRWIKEYEREQVVERLAGDLNLLNTDIKKLIKVRLDPNNQYPSLAVSSILLSPNRERLNILFTLSVTEANENNTQIKRPEVYKTLISARYLWGQILSGFRMYLANRLGSFDKNLLPTQEHDIEVLYNLLQAKFGILQQYANEGKLGFELTDSLPSMLKSLQQWFNGFKKVKVIHHSDEWRSDTKIMKSIISPRIERITYGLILLEAIVGDSAIYDINIYNSLGQEQNKILWLIAFIGIFFTVFMIWSLDRLIFEPISLVSKALKLEALGKKSDDIVVVKTQETKDLVDAFSDMSYQVHLRQKELEYRALHDSLTSLPNRTLLLDRIEYGINTAKRQSQELSLLVLDLDNFKDVNDTLGHFAGDDLLIKVGNRISRVLRNIDTIARIGGDEFSVLLPNTNEEQAIITAQKILSIFMRTINIDGVEISISSSIGIAVYPENGEDVSTLLRHADVAMYMAKNNKLGFDVYSKEQDGHSISRLSMTRDFRDAMANDNLHVEFQPIYDIAHKNIVAVEALSRWQHPERGNVSPEKFILLAEQTNLINNLTYLVLEKSIKQVALWHKSGHYLSVAVNLSVFSFKDPDFIGEVRTLLRKYNFPGNKLKLEITESAMMDNPLQAIEILSQLHKMDIKLSIDDFGTGFSSMTYLKKFPVDELKIDKSFVIGLDSDKNNDAIVRSTIDLAHNLGLKVVAEGIESEDVYCLLKQYGCDMAQGFHLSRPVKAHIVDGLLKADC